MTTWIGPFATVRFFVLFVYVVFGVICAGDLVTATTGDAHVCLLAQSRINHPPPHLALSALGHANSIPFSIPTQNQRAVSLSSVSTSALKPSNSVVLHRRFFSFLFPKQQQNQQQQKQNDNGNEVDVVGQDNKYRIVRKIGQGAFGTVYAGQAITPISTTTTQVALKFVKRDPNDPSIDTSFIHEIELGERLAPRSNTGRTNPFYIIPLDAFLHVDPKQGTSFDVLVIELATGGSLHSLIKSFHSRQQVLPIQITARYMWDLVRGLVLAENMGVANRDIKSENILLVQKPYTSGQSLVDFTAKYADLGLAADLTKELGRLPSSICGTPAYWAPELDNAYFEPYQGAVQADVFSLGQVFHELLFGDIAPKHPQSMHAVLSLRNLQSISAEAADLLQRMLWPYPSFRIKAKELLKHPFFLRSSHRRSRRSFK